MDDKKKKKVIFIGSAIFLFLVFAIYIASGLPSLEELENPRPQLASKVYSIDGEVIGQYFIENRIETDIDSVPAYLVNALIATEDRRFYNHWGVDLQRFLTAMIKNLFTLSKEGGGASTITQQLAKNLYKLKGSNENAFGTVVRKIREWITAVQIERTYTKKEILELYLNVSYFGKSAYGVESASRVYFNKRARELTLPESALLIALLKSSVVYDPERRQENALRRRNLVMYNMIGEGFLTEEKYQKLKLTPIQLARGKKVKMRSDAAHFLEYLRPQMEDIAEKHGLDLYRDGLQIYSTIDSRMQLIANKVAAEHLKEYQEIFYKNWKWENNKTLLNQLLDKAIKNSPEYKEAGNQSSRTIVYNQLKNDKRFVDSVKKVESTIQIGFVVMDPKNGHIRALVGGQNQEFAYGLNHVTQIRRQAGSAFKPFVYAVAIDNGCFPQYSLLNEQFNYNGWSPANSDGKYGGYMTLREALAKSVNVIAGRLTTSELAEPRQVIRYAKRMGITSNLSAYPSIALGVFEVSPLEMCSGFATFANKGIYNSPVPVLRIEDKNGIVLEEFKAESREALSRQTAAIVVNMMEDVVNYGTGASVRRYFHKPAAGKTGTTNDYADAWFNGFTPQLVGTVWVGFDDHRVKFNGWYGQGARAALPVWAKFMQQTYNQLKLPLEYFNLPDGVISADFCVDSIERGEAHLATENCPSKVNDILRADKLPERCTIHGGGLNRGDSEW